MAEKGIDKYRSTSKKIPWHSTGRDTVASKVGRCVVPVGVLPFDPIDVPTGTPRPVVVAGSEGWEGVVMRIAGTAIQFKERLLVTCAHVVDVVTSHPQNRVAILGSLRRRETVMYCPYPVAHAFRYIDPRTGKVNKSVDLAILAVPHASTPELPYPVEFCRWGNSARLGVGDEVLVVGYPHGERMALYLESNRGILQPTFYRAIISGILPATTKQETRLLQLDLALAGGISGGAVFDPSTGRVVGMVTSGLDVQLGTDARVPLSHSWAIPSEVIQPYAESLEFR